jgi:hypothetical protein
MVISKHGLHWVQRTERRQMIGEVTAMPDNPEHVHSACPLMIGYMTGVGGYSLNEAMVN